MVISEQLKSEEIEDLKAELRERVESDYRWVLAGDGLLSTMYLGRTSLMGCSDLLLKMGVPFSLKLIDCRIFRYYAIDMMTDRGPGTQMNAQVLPFPLSTEGGEITITPKVYIDLDSKTADPQFRKRIMELLKMCQGMEKDMAERIGNRPSGLYTPGD